MKTKEKLLKIIEKIIEDHNNFTVPMLTEEAKKDGISKSTVAFHMYKNFIPNRLVSTANGDHSTYRRKYVLTETKEFRVSEKIIRKRLPEKVEENKLRKLQLKSENNRKIDKKLQVLEQENEILMNSVEELNSRLEKVHEELSDKSEALDRMRYDIEKLKMTVDTLNGLNKTSLIRVNEQEKKIKSLNGIISAANKTIDLKDEEISQLKEQVKTINPYKKVVKGVVGLFTSTRQ